MTISNGVTFLLSTTTIAGTTAAKAALTRIVFGMSAIAAAFIATMVLRFRKSSAAQAHAVTVMNPCPGRGAP